MSQIVSGFRSFFSTAVNTRNSQAMLLTNLIWREPSSMIFNTSKAFRFKEVTPTEICNHIKKLQKKKLAGCDNVPFVFLKDAKEAMTKPPT